MAMQSSACSKTLDFRSDLNPRALEIYTDIGTAFALEIQCRLVHTVLVYQRGSGGTSNLGRRLLELEAV
jgi:hypothetical protein